MSFALIDGNWLDMLTIVAGFFAIFIKPMLRRRLNISPRWVHRDAINDFLTGASIVPFALLLGAIFNKWILDQLIQGSKVSLGLAGGIGVMFVLKELFSVRKQDGGSSDDVSDEIGAKP